MKPTEDDIKYVANFPQETAGQDETTRIFEQIFTHPKFIDSRLRLFIDQLSDMSGRTFTKGNDTMASFLLAITQRLDFRDIFQKKYTIRSKNSPNKAVALTENTFLVGANIASVSQIPQVYRLEIASSSEDRYRDGGVQTSYPSGVLATTRFSSEYVTATTGRLLAVAAFKSYLCSPINEMVNFNLDHNWIRSDIARNADFFTKCSGCHAGIDAISGAGADMSNYYGFVSREAVRDRVASGVARYHKNAHIEKDGHVMSDSFWINVFTTDEYMRLYGWRGPHQGYGLASFGELISNSRRFQDCMTARILSTFCAKGDRSLPAIPDTNPVFRTLSDELREDNYNILSHVRRVVRSELCLNI